MKKITSQNEYEIGPHARKAHAYRWRAVGLGEDVYALLDKLNAAGMDTDDFDERLPGLISDLGCFLIEAFIAVDRFENENRKKKPAGE